MCEFEFLCLSPIEKAEIVTLSPERIAILNDCYDGGSLPNSEFIAIYDKIYLEQAIENGVVTE